MSEWSTSEETILKALDGAFRVSYQSLLDRVSALGSPPRGMLHRLESLERAGVIRQLDRQGRRWNHMGDHNRGPLYIELRARL